MGLRSRLADAARRFLADKPASDRGPNWPRAASPDGLQPLLWDHEVGYEKVTPVTLPDGNAGVVICSRRGVFALRGVDPAATLDRERNRLVAGSRSWDLYSGRGEGAPDAVRYAARSQHAVTWIGGPCSPPTVVDRVEVTLQPLIVTIPAGLYPPADLAWRDLAPGTGAPAGADEIFEVDYLGVLWSTGQVFDSTWRRKRRYRVDMRSPTLLEGWRRGLLGLRAGGTRVLVVPPELGYGEEEIEETVPSGDTLIFVVQRPAG
jgi:peptidylprolyl isomerase